MNVTKRNGTTEEFDAEKINKVLAWACENISGVSDSTVAMNAKLSIVDGIQTDQIHDLLIESAANLIDEASPNYSQVASNLLNYKLRKCVWGGFNPPKLYDHIYNRILNNVYDSDLLEWYTKEEINKIDEVIEHDLDYNFQYAGIRQLIDKYLLKNRETGEIYETPQFVYALVAMILFSKYEPTSRMKYVKLAYKYFSRHKINIPTPIMAGIRSIKKSGASCCLIEMDDDLNSIAATASAAMLATSSKYGMGIDMSKIRPIGSPIRGGDTTHTGVIPFLKVIESSIKSCKQGSARRGAGTVTFPIFHPEIEDILVLKNNTGTEDNRVRHLDYSISISKLFWDRLKDNKHITLFSSAECPELYDTFGLPEFDGLYEKAEKRKDLKFKTKISAQKLFSLLMKERIETGRIYMLNIDNANKYNPWSNRVSMSNLCVVGETLLMTPSGEKRIDSLIDETVDVWNGKKWSPALVKKTGENKRVMSVFTKRGKSLMCTHYHRFLIYDEVTKTFSEKLATDLNIGDKVISFDGSPNMHNVDEISRIQDKFSYADVYCVGEPEEHAAVFNEILTGNCQEILHETTPMYDLNDADSRIGVCVLAAINMDAIRSDSEHEKVCDVVVRMLDELIDYQDYFSIGAEKFAKERRSLGIGVTNYASWLAGQGLKMTDKQAPIETSKWMEKQQYFLIKASCELAKEKGPCAYYENSQYVKGILPCDNYEKATDEFASHFLGCNWDDLRSDLSAYGIRNMTLSAIMPCEACLKWDTKIITEGGEKDFHQICEEGGVNWKDIEDNQIRGWYTLENPIKINDELTDSIFYNGYSEVFEIELEDGSIIKCTENHKFMTKDGWKRACDLLETDEIIE